MQLHGAFSPCINVDFIQSFLLLTLLQARNAGCMLTPAPPRMGWETPHVVRCRRAE
jgi:hypothetical protein